VANPPVVDKVTGAHAVVIGEQADNDLGVANVDGQQHPFSPLACWRPNCHEPRFPRAPGNEETDFRPDFRWHREGAWVDHSA